jgi:hypothetical protein
MERGIRRIEKWWVVSKYINLIALENCATVSRVCFEHILNDFT